MSFISQGTTHHHTQAGFCLSGHRHPKAPHVPCHDRPCLGSGIRSWEPQLALFGAALPHAGPQQPPPHLSHQGKQNKNLNLKQFFQPPGGVRVPGKTPFVISAPPLTLWSETFCLCNNKGHF